jgi:serine protease Do
MPRRSHRIAILALILGGSFLAGSWLAPRFRIVVEPGPLPDQALAQTTRAAVSADEPVAKAVSVVAPSVVNIDTVQRVTRNDFFFGPQHYESQGAGSGVVIDPKGYVLTNEHVAANASQITVTFENGKKYRGHVIGQDHETDVAVVKLDNPAGIPAARLGDSRKLIPGQWAVAIGNPYGYGQTVTVGVVSHTGRAVQVEDRLYKSLVQTDAAINPGNSGGPLIDIHGSVIGINTVVRSGAQGIGFAIPIHLAKAIADELILHGKIKRPWTGLNAQPVSPEIAAMIGLERVEGVFVDRLDRRGPAFKAGVRPGDVIREIGGRKIRALADVDTALGNLKIGQKIPIVVEREGQMLKGELIVEEKP